MPSVTFTTSGGLQKSALRQANERLVLNAIRQNPSVSRADIVRLTGLSPSSVTFIVNRLKRDKMVREEKTAARGQVGRQPTALHLRQDARVALGVEITMGGARILATDLNDTVIARKGVAWHPHHEIFLAKVHRAIRSVLGTRSRGEVLGVGVSLPGFIDRGTGKVIAAEALNWFGVEAGLLLRQDLPVPFHFENCAKLSALSEMWFSQRDPKPLRDFVFVMARDGLGTGVVTDGYILQGAACGAAEFGHVVLYPDGRRCACGNSGCWEQYASDLAVARLYRERAGITGGDGAPDAESIVAEACAGDPVARDVLLETACHVGLGFGNLVVALNPEAIVLGDYLASAWELIGSRVWGVLRARVPGYYLTGMRILPSRHRAEASLRGAAAMVLSRFFSSFDHGSRACHDHAVALRYAT